MSKLTRSSAVTTLLMVPDHHQRPQLAEWRLRTADLAKLHSVAVASVSVDSSGVKSWQEEQSPSNGIHQSWDRGPPLIGSNFPQQTIQPPCHPHHTASLLILVCGQYSDTWPYFLNRLSYSVMAKVNKATSILSHVNSQYSHDSNEELYVFYRTINVWMSRERRDNI